METAALAAIIPNLAELICIAIIWMYVSLSSKIDKATNRSDLTMDMKARMLSPSQGETINEAVNRNDLELKEISDIIWFDHDNDEEIYDCDDPIHLATRHDDLRDFVHELEGQNEELEKRIEVLEGWVRHLGGTPPPTPS